MTSNVAKRSRPARAPDLVRVARLAMDELSAQGLVLVDARSGSDQIVAREGEAPESTSALPAAAAFDRRNCLVTRQGTRTVVSARMDIDDENAVGALHLVFDGEPPADRVKLERLARAFARHAALTLAYGSLRSEHDQRSIRLARLSSLDELVDSANTLDDITPLVTRALKPLTGAAAACITVWDEERDILRALPGAFGASDRALHASMTGPTSNPQSLASRVFITGRPYMTNRAARDPGLHQAYIDAFHIDRVLAVPLNRGRRRVGVMILINKPTDFTFADIAVAQGVTSRIAMAVELASTMYQLRVQQRLEGILARTAVAVATGRGVDECLRPAFQQLCEVTEATMVGLIPREGGTPLLWRAVEPPAELEERLISDACALVHGSVGAFPQAVGDPGWAALHAPVELYGERTAALSILRQNGQPFRSHEATVVARLANIAALAWATERYQHQLAELARLRERERIADELHDRVAQILFAAQLGLDSILESPEDAPVDRQRILEIGGLLVKGDAAIRDVIAHLSVEQDTTVSRRLRLEVESVEEEFGVAIHVELDNEDAINAVRRPVADCMLKVVREATINAVKHAGPCRITMSVTGDESTGLTLTVVDDGIGPGPALTRPGHRGVPALRRAVNDVGGTLKISRASKAFGTRVTAVFPPGA